MKTIAEYPTACPACRSGMRSMSGSRSGGSVSFACASVWTTTGNAEQFNQVCALGADPICSNCDGGGCVCVVVRDWEAAAACDGRCCPDCGGSGVHAHN